MSEEEEEEEEFIDAIQSLANQEFPVGCRDELSTSLNNGNFMIFLNVLKIMAQFLKII